MCVYQISSLPVNQVGKDTQKQPLILCFRSGLWPVSCALRKVAECWSEVCLKARLVRGLGPLYCASEVQCVLYFVLVVKLMRPMVYVIVIVRKGKAFVISPYMILMSSPEITDPGVVSCLFYGDCAFTALWATANFPILCVITSNIHTPLQKCCML